MSLAFCGKLCRLWNLSAMPFSSGRDAGMPCNFAGGAGWIMTSMSLCDLSLFGVWPRWRAYAVSSALETKAAVNAPGTEEGPEGLWRLLNEMTLEMRAQFGFFRTLRQGAQASPDEAAGASARADVKAATDAMSLIVRTLEKIDALQRQLALDREAEAEREADSQSYADAVAFLEKRIDQLVLQKIRAGRFDAGLAEPGSVACEGARTTDSEKGSAVAGGSVRFGRDPKRSGPTV